MSGCECQSSGKSFRTSIHLVERKHLFIHSTRHFRKLYGYCYRWQWMHRVCYAKRNGKQQSDTIDHRSGQCMYRSFRDTRCRSRLQQLSMVERSHNSHHQCQHQRHLHGNRHECLRMYRNHLCCIYSITLHNTGDQCSGRILCR